MAIGPTNASSSAIKTLVTVTVVDSSSAGYQSGRTVVVSHSSGRDTQTATTDSTGVLTFKLKFAGTYTITCNVPDGGSVETQTLEVELGGSYTSTLTISFGWGTFSMTFNATTFQSDPTGCLTYGDDCAGYTPVSGPGSSLAKCSTIGSWLMNADGTSTNPLLAECFYATFTSNGVLHQKLNPQDLTKYIATWDNTNKKWVSASGNSSITSEDTMFCIPTCYKNGSSTKVLISGSASNGTAFGHTIGGHVYEYLAIAVYPAYDDGSKLWSRSGTNSTVSTTRPTFRSHAAAKTIQNGYAMVWNYYQWDLWRLLVLFACKSFNTQAKIGQGGYSYGAKASGKTNTMGPFAGSTSTSASESTGVKAFIENGWGHNYDFIDDFLNVQGVIYAGQNSSVDDNSSSKTNLGSFSANTGWANAISTAAATWGIGTNNSGSSTAGLCDYQWTGTGGTYLGRGGGASADVSGGRAGPSCLDAYNDLSRSRDYFGARLAFVFDL
ncbi:MAG: carboxypeptidase regulatory-like domain-containing protein [Thermoplasmata archaeon]|nr:carboxypeptidase regulatory-like domain-containing protein [Thermoplasmata archaeon]